MSEQRKRIGSFAVEHELSQDELGSWYRAVDERLGRLVALRIWRFGPATEGLRPAVRERARAAAALVHPNLPMVYAREANRRADLLSMEFIDGESISEVLASRRYWRPLDAARLVIGLADALAAAHAVGVTHGRIGPERVRQNPDGRLMLLGIGIVRSAAETRAGAADRMAKTEDVRALANLLKQMCPPAPNPASPWDPMLAVEAGVIEPVVEAVLRDELPDAASFRNALVKATSPVAGARRAAAQPPRATPTPIPFPEAPEPESAGSERPPGLGGLAVFLPENELEPEERRGAAFFRIAAGVALGALLAVGSVAAFRSGLFERDRIARALEPASQTVEDVVSMATRDGQGEGGAVTPTDPPPVAPPIRDTATDVATEETGAVEQEAGPPQSEEVTETPRPAPTPPPPPPPPPPPVEEEPREETPARPEMQTASVIASPRDAFISRADEGSFLGLGSAQVSVAQGDSIVLEFNRAGYIPVRRVFRGEPLSVTLRPDSVQVTFAANIPVEVEVESPAGTRVLGTTNLTAQLTPGIYRITFRTPDRPEWSARYEFPRAGASYRVSKMDYPLRGSLVVAVEGGWARVSLNGGTPRETPARFDNLPLAPHIIRLTRDGYETVVDTVHVTPGQVTSRQYRLRPLR